MSTQPLPFIPETAPFNAAQRAWLNGFLAGLFAPGAEQTAAAPALDLTILYGTQTGTAASLCRKFAKEAGGRGFNAKAVDMAQFKASELKDTTHLLVVTSTYGDGEPPDGAKALHAELHSESAARLENLEYSVLGLGDTIYEKFCACAVEFDERLEKLGAKRVFPRVDCDLDFEASAKGWLDGVLAVWKDQSSQQVPLVVEEREAVPLWTKANPFPARLLDNRVLNGTASAKETRHLALSLEGSGLTYEAGDALGVMPSNCPELVEAVIQALGFSGEESVASAKGGQVALKLALTTDYDLGAVNKASLEKYAKLRGGDLPAVPAGFHWLDLLSIHPAKGISAKDFVGVLRKLQPRLYSIASSSKAHPGEVHLCVGIVRYESDGRPRKGVCSTFLADRAAESAPVFIHRNENFRLPSDEGRDVIMIGPGTGIAPFRAFLQERKATGATGRNWLFFGDQRSACDFLYQEELGEFQKSGHLHALDVAFSRDQEEKVYVQHRMAERADELWKWIEGGAAIYVCGDASRMAKDVETELHRVIESAGGKTANVAKAFVDQLKAEKRYLRDVY